MRRTPGHPGRHFLFPEMCPNCCDPEAEHAVPLVNPLSLGHHFGLLGVFLDRFFATAPSNHVSVCDACRRSNRRREFLDVVSVVALIAVIPAIGFAFAFLGGGRALRSDELPWLAGVAVAWVAFGALLAVLSSRRERAKAHDAALSRTIGIALVSHGKRWRDVFREATALYTLTVRVCHPKYARELIRVNAPACEIEFDERALQAMEDEALVPRN